MLIVRFKKIFALGSVAVFSFFLSACYTLLEPTVIKKADLSQFNYVFINPTDLQVASVGSSFYSSYSTPQANYGNGRGHGRNTIAHGGSDFVTKTVVPRDVIAGMLMKHGFIVLKELDPKYLEKTLIVTYGESGRRELTLGGNTIEVSIQFMDTNKKLVCLTTAEGYGQTDADDIKEAITRAIDAIFTQHQKPKQ